MAQTECVHFINREFAVFHIERERSAPLSLARYSYGSIPKLYGLLEVPALESSGIPEILDQPALRANGRGVILGIIDTGIDYTDPLFQNPDGTTRILGIWDQSLPAAQPPEPVSGFPPFYGTTFGQEQINAALASDAPYELVPTRDENGHGTRMAKLAAGSRDTPPGASPGTPPGFFGAAPEATLAIVKLKPAKQYLRDFYLVRPDAECYQENDIMAGISYLTGLANLYKMPVVICLGLGTNQGSHTGATPLGIQIQSFDGYTGIAFVAAAGNEVGFQTHFSGDVQPEQLYEDVEVRTEAGDPGFCLELWAQNPELYTVGFVSPSGEIIDRIGLSLGTDITIPFRFDGTTITVNYLNNEAGSGSQLIFLRFEKPSAGIWHIRVYPSVVLSGQFHMWLPLHDFLSDRTVFLRPDPDTTITDPGNAAMPITVSTYNHINNSIYIHSSRGYSRTGAVKPDLAAPGVDLLGSTGSSLAAAITAGAVADLFTWGLVDRNDLTMTSASAKTMLVRGASRNPALSYPNREWGYGALNLYGAFNSLR